MADLIRMCCVSRMKHMISSVVALLFPPINNGH